MKTERQKTTTISGKMDRFLDFFKKRKSNSTNKMDLTYYGFDESDYPKNFVEDLYNDLLKQEPVNNKKNL